ncbi:peptidoglycan-recognition protein LF-like [Lutzomyia longipalpis]|uniref:Putative peptidoglycan recognition protein lc n=1 Tax=Lutzomyia longipalpis TaxID=7200 RepID=A0A1B0CCB7_LUTLO|nr:peptidoglycan-recognition protein LF-like [Lutzomyia longipalpis]
MQQQQKKPEDTKFESTEDEKEKIKSCWCYGSVCTGWLLFLFSVVSIIMIVVFLSMRGDPDCHELSDSESEEEESTTIDIEHSPPTDDEHLLRIVSRNEWEARPELNEPVHLHLPTKRVILAHTATDNCTTLVDCIKIVKDLQKFHMDTHGWDDIGYNFLVGGDGSAYEGRGWEKQGAHTKNYNVNAIGIAFIGTFNKVTPPEEQLRAFRNLLQWGIDSKKLDEMYKLFGHRQFSPTSSPGQVLYDIIKKWPHWSENIN